MTDPFDCIYVCSRRAGERVMATVQRFLTRRLKLKVNAAKSAVDPPRHAERMFARERELKNAGLDHAQAHGTAWLEERVRQWPSGWGDDLHVLLYGDFQAPPSTLTYRSLDIIVHPENMKNTIVRGALTVLKATVRVHGKSVPALIDAARRINLLLGTWTLHSWGNSGCGWWSWVTHDSVGGAMPKFAQDGMEKSATAIIELSPEVRKKVQAALFWVREPRNLILEGYRPNVLRIYSSYWNAFECLVEAFNIIKPRVSLSKTEKKARIDEFFRERELTAQNIKDCFRNIVDTGFRGKASHALTTCFGDDGERYIKECFGLPDKENRLYDVRNAINHGNIDAENPNEAVRVEARLRRLWMIVWGMFGRLIPFPAPGDSEDAL